MAIDLGKWLRDRKKQLDGVGAQVNPFDGGKTYNTVANNRQPTPQQQRPVQQVNQQQPGWSVRKQPSFDVIRPPKTTQQLINDSYGKGVSGFINKTRDQLKIDGADTVADQIRRRSQSGLNEDYTTQQDRLTKQAQANPSTRNTVNQFAASGLREVGNFVGKAPGAAGNLYGSVVQSENPFVRTARGIIPGLNAAADADKMVGHRASTQMQKDSNNFTKQVTNKINQSQIGERAGENKWAVGAGSLTTQLPLQMATGGAGILNQSAQFASDEYNKARAAGKSNDAALAIGTLQGAASGISEKIGLDKFMPGNGVTGNILTKAGKRFLTEGGQEAQQQFTQNLIANKTYDPNQSLKDGVLESAVLGGLAGGVTSPFVDVATTPKQQTTPALQPQDIALIKDISEAQVNPQNYTSREQAILQQGAIDLNNRTGVDLLSGSRSDINVRAGQAIENFQGNQPAFNPIQTPVNQMTDPQSMRERIRAAKERVLTPLNEGGYIQTPGKVDPLDGLRNEARKYKSGAELFENLMPTDRDVVRRLYPDLDQAQKFAKFYQEATGKVKDRLDVKTTPQLLAEAKKHDTAKEFIDKMVGSATQYGSYDPSLRIGGTGGSRLTELGVDPNKTVTIYRGIDNDGSIKNSSIRNGDFVTTDYDSALSYASDPLNVVSKKVKAKDLISEDDSGFKDEPFYVGMEYIYSTKQNAKAPLGPQELTQIWEDANGYTLENQPEATPKKSLTEKLGLKPLNQGGYAQIPFGKEVSDGLSNDQTEFINEYANMLEDMGSGNGVSINKETGTRISNNARSADIKGKNMSKYDWFEKARQDIEGGKAMYGASEDYKALPGVEAQISQDKPKGLVVSETKPVNGQKIQKVRTGPGKVEQRVVQDQSSVIADALGIPQEQRTPTSSFDKQAAQTQRVADNINSKDDNIAYNEQPRDIKQKKSKVQFTETFNRWLGTKQAAKTRSVATARTLKKLNNSDALEAIQAIDNSSYVPKSDKAKQFVEQFRTKTDVLYQRYTGEKGVNMGYVEDYLPRIYKNPEGGEPLTKAEYQALQMSTGRMKGREADQIDVDALITKDPRELLAKYVDSMENVVNNRSFVDSLKKSGHLIESPSRPQGTVIIDAPGFPQPRVFTNPDTGEKIQGNYYATPDVAKVLNRSFEPDIRTSTTGKVLKKTAAVAGKVQDLGLSGGVPGTPINAFGFAQILRNTMGGNIRGTAKGTALSFSKRATDRYFDKHSEDLAELQEQGINVRTSYTEKGLQSFMKRVASAENKKGNSTIPAKTKQLFDESWDTAMNDPTFSRLLPVMQLDYYRHVRDNLKRVGVAPDKASKIAAKRLKEFEGLTDQATLAGRNKVANDALTTFLFAPKYRESMIKFWGNNIKALAPQNIVKALNPKSGEYRSNLIFNAAAVFLFMMMDKENQEQNEGRHLWDNPPGKKDKLLVKIGNGQTIGIPFLSSIATMPRTALNLGNDVISGNTEQLGKDAKSFLGYGIRPIADIVTNEDYFGNKIRRDGASFGENLKRSGMFALKQYNHPYIKAGISKVQSGNTKDPNDPNKKTDLQIVSEAAESPVRFYKDKSVKYGLMYEKFDKDLKGVSNQTKQQFERWHPGRNDMGELEPFDSNNFYSKERADALQDNDLYALEKKYAELQNKYHGKPLDPIFTLGEQERRLVLNKKALKPGQTDPELSKLYDKEWYQDYQNKSSQYYASKNEWNTAQGFESTFKNDNPYPEVPKELQNAMDFYSSLPKGTGARSGFIKSNPDVWSAMTNQWAMKDNWENKERAKYGLAATEGDAGVSNGFKEPTTKYASSSSKGGKGGKGGKGKKLGAIDFGTTDLVSTNKRLQALLGGTTVKAPKNKKVAVKKPKLKKVA